MRWAGWRSTPTSHPPGLGEDFSRLPLRSTGRADHEPLPGCKGDWGTLAFTGHLLPNHSLTKKHPAVYAPHGAGHLTISVGRSRPFVSFPVLYGQPHSALIPTHSPDVRPPPAGSFSTPYPAWPPLPFTIAELGKNPLPVLLFSRIIYCCLLKRLQCSVINDLIAKSGVLISALTLSPLQNVTAWSRIPARSLCLSESSLSRSSPQPCDCPFSVTTALYSRLVSLAPVLGSTSVLSDSVLGMKTLCRLKPLLLLSWSCLHGSPWTVA